MLGGKDRVTSNISKLRWSESDAMCSQVWLHAVQLLCKQAGLGKYRITNVLMHRKASSHQRLIVINDIETELGTPNDILRNTKVPRNPVRETRAYIQTSLIQRRCQNFKVI